MAYLRIGTNEDIDTIMMIVKEVVTHMNTVDGNFQWCCYCILYSDSIKYFNTYRDNSYPLKSDFTTDVIDKTLWVACSTESNEVIGFAG